MYKKFLWSVRSLTADQVDIVWAAIEGFGLEIGKDPILTHHWERFFKGVKHEPGMLRHEEDESIARFIANYLQYYEYLSNKRAEVEGNPLYGVSKDFIERRVKTYNEYGVEEAIREELGLKQIIRGGRVIPPESKVQKFRSLIRGSDEVTMNRPLTEEQDAWLIKNFHEGNIYRKAAERYRNPLTGAIQKDLIFVANFMNALHKADMQVLIEAFGFYGPREIIEAYHYRRSRGAYSQLEGDKIISDLFGYTYESSSEAEVLDFIMDGLTADQRELLLDYYKRATGETQEESEDDFEVVEGIDVFEEAGIAEGKKRKKERRKRPSKGQRKHLRAAKAEARRNRS